MLDFILSALNLCTASRRPQKNLHKGFRLVGKAWCVRRLRCKFSTIGSTYPVQDHQDQGVVQQLSPLDLFTGCLSVPVPLHPSRSHPINPSVVHLSTNQMTAASLRRWPLSRTGHCVIDPIVPWASISSTTSSARPSSFQLQQPLQLTRSYHQHRCHQYSFQTCLQHSPYIIFTTARPAPNTTFITPPPNRTMSSDNDYMSFLNKANADLNASQFQPQRGNTSSTPRTQTIHTNVRVPAPLTSVDAFYVSETDEPFEPVALKWPDAERGIWPDAGESAC